MSPDEAELAVRSLNQLFWWFPSSPVTHPHETEQDVFIEGAQDDSQQRQQQHLHRVYPA